ncbi:MAG: peptidoglycan-binding protein [bacterium]|nr:peptidoglycan-binding protein [bacterium]
MRFFFPSVLLAIILALGVLATPVDAETFTTNLTIGSRGADVVLLQQFLVVKGYLQMPAGVSYGYFGYLTRGAVAGWQSAHGIAPAVGYFGPISRQAFNTKLTTSAPVAATPVNPAPVPVVPTSFSFLPSVEADTLAAPGMRVDQVMLFRASPFEVRSGDTLVLDGSGFSKTLNKIYFNGSQLATAVSTDGTNIEMFVPAGLSEGEYRLSVSNTLGSSDNPAIKIAIKVTSQPQPGPTIESASAMDGTVTLVGSGFTAANKIITTLGNLSGPVSSNGATLTFRITELSMYDKIKQFTRGGYQAPLWIYVKNEHGINREPYKLEIII